VGPHEVCGLLAEIADKGTIAVSLGIHWLHKGTWWSFRKGSELHFETCRIVDTDWWSFWTVVCV